jgi:chromosome segregation ATPase
MEFTVYGETFTLIPISLSGLFLFLTFVVFVKWRFQARKSKSLQAMVDEMDQDKAQMYSKLKALEEENKELKERMEKTEAEYSERVRALEEKEKKLKEDSKEVEEKLGKLRAMEETIEMHRVKIGVLETEKRDLQVRLNNLTAAQEKELSTEKEKLEALKRELKEKTKEALSKLTAENEELKKKVETLKERLSLWESVKDL